MRIAPARFRALAFDQEWGRLIGSVGAHRLGAAPPDLDEAFEMQDWVRVLLGVERNRWLSAGLRVGYFEGEEPRDEDRPEYEDALAFYFDADPDEDDLVDFARKIEAAQDAAVGPALTRVGYMLFGDGIFWSRRVEEVRAFAARLEQDPWWQPAPWDVDAIEWSLLGEPPPEPSSTPAAWRLSRLRDYRFGPEPSVVRERAEELELARNHLAEIIYRRIEAESASEYQVTRTWWRGPGGSALES
jgi:hypothetical protein